MLSIGPLAGVAELARLLQKQSKPNFNAVGMKNALMKTTSGPASIVILALPE